MIAVLLMMSLLKIKYASDIQKFKTGIFVQFFFSQFKNDISQCLEGTRFHI